MLTSVPGCVPYLRKLTESKSSRTRSFKRCAANLSNNKRIRVHPKVIRKMISHRSKMSKSRKNHRSKIDKTTLKKVVITPRLKTMARVTKNQLIRQSQRMVLE